MYWRKSMQYYSAFLSAFAYAFHTLPQPIPLLLRQRLLLLYSFPVFPLLSLPRPEGSRNRGIRSLLDLAEGPAVPAALANSIISFICTQNQPFLCTEIIGLAGGSSRCHWIWRISVTPRRRYRPQRALWSRWAFQVSLNLADFSDTSAEV